MRVKANEIYHLHNTGNNGQQLFRDRETYRLFLSMFNKYLGEFCEVVCWGLVPGQFSFMIKVKDEGAEMIKVGNITMSKLANGVRNVQSQFARIMNRRLGRTGSYFKCKCKADKVENDMYNVLFNKIHNMPVNSGYVMHESEWPYSSSADYKKGRKFDLCNTELAISLLGSSKYKVEKKGFYFTLSERTRRTEIGNLRGKEFMEEHILLHKLRYQFHV